MRWVRYEQDGAVGYGRIAGEQVEAIAGEPWGEHNATGATHPLSAVRLLPPVVPTTFYAAGLNYTEHLKKYAALGGGGVPEKPDIGYRANNALVGHDAPVLIPRDAGPRVHYEAELVAVIGKRARHLTPENALDCVFGYTIGNDVSERDWQKADRTMWRSKNSDTWKPMGPWIETDFDLAAARTTVRVNGQQTIEFETGAMLFDLPTYLVAMSRYLTLHPGDVIWLGTEGTSPDLKAGDVVEIDISGIGTLRNRFELGD